MRHELERKYEDTKKQTIKKPPLTRTAGAMPRELQSTGIKGKVPRLYITMFPNSSKRCAENDVQQEDC